MADKYLIEDLSTAQLETFKQVAQRIKDTAGLDIRKEIADGAVYDIGDVPEVGFKFIARDNKRISDALEAARDSRGREVFVDGDRGRILTGRFDLCDVAALASSGVAYREINYKNFADLMEGPQSYLPEGLADKQWRRKFSNSFNRLHMDLSSLHFTVPKQKMDGDDLAKCDAHIDHTGFISDFGTGPGMMADFPNHTINELGIGVGGRLVLGNWFADHFRFVLPSSETKFANEAGISLQFRPSKHVTVEIYATNKGVLQNQLQFVDTDRLLSMPTNYGFNVFGSF